MTPGPGSQDLSPVIPAQTLGGGSGVTPNRPSSGGGMRLDLEIKIYLLLFRNHPWVAAAVVLPVLFLVVLVLVG